MKICHFRKREFMTRVTLVSIRNSGSFTESSENVHFLPVAVIAAEVGLIVVRNVVVLVVVVVVSVGVVVVVVVVVSVVVVIEDAVIFVNIESEMLMEYFGCLFSDFEREKMSKLSLVSPSFLTQVTPATSATPQVAKVV